MCLFIANSLFVIDLPKEERKTPRNICDIINLDLTLGKPDTIRRILLLNA